MLLQIKQGNYSTTLCFKTIYNYIDKEILEVKRKDLTYGNYTKKEKKKEKLCKIILTHKI